MVSLVVQSFQQEFEDQRLRGVHRVPAALIAATKVAGCAGLLALAAGAYGPLLLYHRIRLPRRR